MISEQKSHALLKHYAEMLSNLRLPDNYIDIVSSLSGTLGKIVVTGLGKSGLIARKLSATLSSIGAPSCFMHASEAGHGDLGMLQGTDTLIALSHSGESKECQQALQRAKSMRCFTLAICQSSHSSMAKLADMRMTYPSFDGEFGPHSLAPTSSTCIMLALCDCLAIDIAEFKRMTPHSFAHNHPAGTLGQRLTPIHSIMDRPELCPIINPKASIREAIEAMTQHASGLALICQDNILKAVFSDGDLRRCMINNISLEEPVMTAATPDYSTLSPHDSIYTAENFMKKHKISAIPITENQRLCGCIYMHQIRTFKQ